MNETLQLDYNCIKGKIFKLSGLSNIGPHFFLIQSEFKVFRPGQICGSSVGDLGAI